MCVCDICFSLKKKKVELRRFVELLTLMHSERPKLYAILAFLSAIGLRTIGKII